MKITWYGHSCFMIESSQGSAVIDPYEPDSVPGLSLPPLEADAVFCTHGHLDHSFRDGVKLTGNTPSFEVKLIGSFHDDARGRKRGKNDLVLIKTEGFTVLHMGDIGCEPTELQIREIGAVDVLLIPVGGYYTVDGATAHAIARRLSPRITIPMHYRSGGIGYPLIDTLEPFLALCSEVTELSADSIELPSELSGTVVLKTEL